MIDVSDLHRWFGAVHAVRGAGFSIPAGQTVGLLGPNGAGKTTTLRMLTGILRPQQGSIRIADVDALAHPTKARRHFGYLPESAPSYPEMAVRSFLRYRAGVLGIPARRRRNRVHALSHDNHQRSLPGGASPDVPLAAVRAPADLLDLDLPAPPRRRPIPIAPWRWARR